ncbi:methyl-accepting chemotaxis protein [Salsuginibacillus halophilus]|uniref:Methyl-accepting chemotaxis protein n=1 Tax=Salsuginibacillus halophilus TaxID=517424 RepID=A0A2P8HHW9_9BACI|nr:methyl-accepting chemotaxis protein [Salsuginibacillus halophilus]PSL45791.1 methyl-accepting chemotaxis protein [Salsuginibacillus halophilus]
MTGKESYQFSLRKKLVLGICVVSGITYATSAFFIFVLADMIPAGWAISEDAFIIITLILGFGWSGFLAFLAAPLITKPIANVEQAARRAAAGDLREEIEVSKSDDELRALGLAFNNMSNNLRGMVEDVETNFEQTNKRVDEITSDAETATEQAENISATVTEISQGAESSATSIQKTAESMEEVTQLASEVQHRAHASQDSSKEMVETLNESRNVVYSLVEGIQFIEGENKESRQAVEALDAEAKKVEEIISMVGDIAEQTNLLALNASIEAARAGEQGKGFAVVAEEVRKLADESQSAVQNVSSVIQNIQREVKNVVSRIEAQVSAASREAQKGSETNEAISEMETSIHNVDEAVKQIASLTEQQLAAIERTSRESQEVAAIAEETSAGAEEVTAATDDQTAFIRDTERKARELSQEANRLKETIETFRTA